MILKAPDLDEPDNARYKTTFLQNAQKIISKTRSDRLPVAVFLHLLRVAL